MMGIPSRKFLVLLLLAVMVSTVLCGSVEDPLGFLRSQPQFEQMRSIVQNDPELLTAVLQQIGQTNPVLLQVFTENQEELLRLLKEDTSTPGSVGDPIMTSQDRDAIERLKSKGFPEDVVVRTYFELDKNETQAENFLLLMDD